jgi:hypothetical protein
MNKVDQIKGDIKKTAKKTAAHPVSEQFFRLGYMARGFIYLVIGLVAVSVAVGSRSAPTDQQGAIAVIGAQPFGRVLLIIVAAGLAGYALWGLVRAVLDPNHHGNDAKGILTRIGYLLSALGYASLLIPTINTIRSAVGSASGGKTQSQSQQAAAGIMSSSWGEWLVGAIGAGFLIAGGLQIIQAIKEDFEKNIQPYGLNPKLRNLLTQIGKFGTAARGVVFVLLGLFLLLAAYSQDAGEVRGVDGALTELLHQPFGSWLLGVVALGLVAFGIYSILNGYWFKQPKA